MAAFLCARAVAVRNPFCRSLQLADDSPRAAYSEVEVMLDVLQHVRKPDDILVPLPMEAVRPSPARFLYEVQLQQAIQKETVEMVSNILLDAASDLDQSLKAAQHLDSESLRLRRRWILANKPGGLTAVDYRYPNGALTALIVGALLLTLLHPQSMPTFSATAARPIWSARPSARRPRSRRLPRRTQWTLTGLPPSRPPRFGSSSRRRTRRKSCCAFRCRRRATLQRKAVACPSRVSLFLFCVRVRACLVLC